MMTQKRRLPHGNVEVEHFSLAAKDTLEAHAHLDFSVDENATSIGGYFSLGSIN